MIYKGALGIKRRVKMVITETVQEHIISWKVIESEIAIAGSVAFEEAGAETFVTFVLSYKAPLVRLGDLISTIFKYPHSQLRRGLDRFTQELESNA